MSLLVSEEDTKASKEEGETKIYLDDQPIFASKMSFLCLTDFQEAISIESAFIDAKCEIYFFAIGKEQSGKNCCVIKCPFLLRSTLKAICSLLSFFPSLPSLMCWECLKENACRKAVPKVDYEIEKTKPLNALLVLNDFFSVSAMSPFCCLLCVITIWRRCKKWAVYSRTPWQEERK